MPILQGHMTFLYSFVNKCKYSSYGIFNPISILTILSKKDKTL